MKTHALSSRRLLSLVIVSAFALVMLGFAAVALHAQSPADAALQTALSGSITHSAEIDPALQAAIQSAIQAAVGPQYEVYALLALALLAAGFRFAAARGNGLSILGSIAAMLKGTNVPKKLPLILAGLCLLSLSSCANDPGSREALIKFGKRVALSVAETAVVVAQMDLATRTQDWINAKTAGDPLKEMLAQTAMLSAQQALTSAAKALAKEQAKLDKQPVKVLPTMEVAALRN